MIRMKTVQNERAGASSLRIAAAGGAETMQASPAAVENSAAAPGRPLLRGRSHAVAAVAAACCSGLLLREAGGDWVKGLALLVYGLSNVLLYGVSALYHTRVWPRRRQAVLRRLDHATIFIMIAGCYTPLTVTMLSGPWRPVLLAGVWVLTASAVAAVTSARPVARRVRVIFYFALGVIALLASPIILVGLRPQEMILPLCTALLAIAGGFVYALRRPALWPRIFGYHELFHLLAIAASSAFFLFVLYDVAPYARR